MGMRAKQFTEEIVRRVRGSYLPVTEFQVYSTDETVIGTYMGKPLYRKVIDFGALPNGGYKDVSSGLSNIKICEYSGIAYSPPDGAVFSLPIAQQTDQLTMCSIRSNGEVVRVVAMADMSSFTEAFITLHYTKNSDTTTSSKVPYQPLIEYSLEERMIGFWIDGKPLYEKTVDCGAMPNATSKSVAHGISNISRFVKGELSTDNGTNGATIVFGSHTNDAMTAYCDRTNIVIASTDDRSEYTGFAIVRYTKTTD